jgi:perosamine synthetase
MKIGYAEALSGVDDLGYRPGTAYPPNSLESSNYDLLRALVSLAAGNSIPALRDELCRMTGVEHISFAPSCRAAIAALLNLLPQSEVVLPAYTCPVVRDAVLLTGKRIIYTDISRATLNSTSREFEEAAKPGRILIATHIFGIPTDIENIRSLARRRDCILIEDAAAALSARHCGQALGSFGDVAVFSFERSKRTPAFRGAAILVNNTSLFPPERVQIASFVPARSVMPVGGLLHALAYNCATIPEVYGRFVLPRILRGFADIPSDGERENLGGFEFYTREFHPYQAALVLRQVRRLGAIRRHISELVQIYRSAFRDSPVRTFLPPDCDDGGLLRFPVVIGTHRAEVLRSTLRQGLYLETNFEQALPDDTHDYPNADWAARNVILLPLYRRLPLPAAKHLASILLSIAQSHEKAVSFGSRRASEAGLANDGSPAKNASADAA